MSEHVEFTLEAPAPVPLVDEQPQDAPDPDQEVQQEAELPEDAPVQVNWQRSKRDRRVLFVDDDERFLNLCLRHFKDSEYTIFTADCADKALDILENQHVDVVVSDMCMPDVNGAELLQAVETRFPDIVRIIISGKFDLADTIEAINRGHIYNYLVKPFNDKDLKLTIYRAIIEKERKEAEARRKQESQQNAKRRAQELGSVVAKSKAAVDQAYGEVVKILSLIAGRRASGSAVEQLVDGAVIAVDLARRAGEPEESCQQVRVAALLQDIALDGGLCKPTGEMTTEEKAEYRHHPDQSAALIQILSPYGEAAEIVRHHHERFDGNGFPRGLIGEEIPRGSRILSLVNAYQQLRTGRNMNHEDAMEVLTSVKDRYDPALFKLLAAREH